jgi:shikimate kinase
MMLNNNRIYIIGFMGSGKSTAGKKLASLLGWSFTDMDIKIEEKAGKTIPEIFSRYGEDYFRKTETEVLKSLDSEKNVVISTGGGAPCHDGNMDYMLATGLTLYLKLTAGQLKSRLSDSSGDRPLIKDLSDEGLLNYIEKKLDSREEFYNRADLTIEGMDLNINLLYSIVKSKLDK